VEEQWKSSGRAHGSGQQVKKKWSLVGKKKETKRKKRIEMNIY